MYPTVPIIRKTYVIFNRVITAATGDDRAHVLDAVLVGYTCLSSWSNKTCDLLVIPNLNN